MALKFNPFLVGDLDFGGGGTGNPLGTQANPFPATGLYWYDTTGVLWKLTLDAAGAIVSVRAADYYASFWGLFANVE